MIKLNEDLFIGSGENRACYRHPLDQTKCIKVDFRQDGGGPTEKEALYYRKLKKIRPRLGYSYIPRFHGFVETSHGKGGVFDLICDEGSNTVSPLFSQELIDKRVSLADPRWKAAHNQFIESLFEDSIIIRDMHPANFCVQRALDGSFRLVAIDGIGHRDFIPFCDYSRWFAHRKLRRAMKRRRFESLEDIISRYRSSVCFPSSSIRLENQKSWENKHASPA